MQGGAAIEAAGSEVTLRHSIEAARPGGMVVWLGKVNVERQVAFRWGSYGRAAHRRLQLWRDAAPARFSPAGAGVPGG